MGLRQKRRADGLRKGPTLRNMQRFQRLRPQQKAVATRRQSRLLWSCCRIRRAAYEVAHNCHREPQDQYCKRRRHHRLSPNERGDREADHVFPSFQAGQRRLCRCRHVFCEKCGRNAPQVHQARRHFGGGSSPWPTIPSVSSGFSKRNLAAQTELRKVIVHDHCPRMQVRRHWYSNHLSDLMPAHAPCDTSTNRRRLDW